MQRMLAHTLFSQWSKDSESFEVDGVRVKSAVTKMAFGPSHPSGCTVQKVSIWEDGPDTVYFDLDGTQYRCDHALHITEWTSEQQLADRAAQQKAELDKHRAWAIHRHYALTGYKVVKKRKGCVTCDSGHLLTVGFGCYACGRQL